jgi:hypothetical protein
MNMIDIITREFMEQQNIHNSRIYGCLEKLNQKCFDIERENLRLKEKIEILEYELNNKLKKQTQ